MSEVIGGEPGTVQYAFDGASYLATSVGLLSTYGSATLYFGVGAGVPTAVAVGCGVLTAVAVGCGVGVALPGCER